MSASKPAIAPNIHFHIRWFPSGSLDWQAFATREQADAAASQLSRVGETYVIRAQFRKLPAM